MISEKCTKCSEIKLVSEFYKDKRRKNGLHSVCKTCVRTQKKEYYGSIEGKEVVQRYIEKHKAKRSEYNKNYLKTYRSSDFKNQRKLEFCLYKGGVCVECGFLANKETIAAFDFHHVDTSKKDYTISDMLMLKKAKVFEELDKCILLCSNCYRILHHRQYRAKLENVNLKTVQEGVETIEKPKAE
ncbi:MAG: hypothetical protein HC795_08050 [Coleofasciculaceae cyanobacterium RL_1_1]|nr:hypothetical protein [Coleofasciculaceae cyanobacterium RL_1_1]